MSFEALIPICLFVSIAWTIKAVLDARVRRHMVESNGSHDLVRSIMDTEEAHLRQASLRWGLVLLALGAGFGTLSAAGLDRPTPAAIAVLLCAVGVGNLAAYWAGRQLAWRPGGLGVAFGQGRET